VHVIAKAAVDRMVLAVHISSDRAAHRDVVGAWGGGQEKSCRHDRPQELIRAYPSSSRHHSNGAIQLDSFEVQLLDQHAVLQLGSVTIGASQPPGGQRPRRRSMNQLL